MPADPVPVPAETPARAPASDALVDAFLEYLATERGASAYTLRNYAQALREFTTWHEATQGRLPDWPRLGRETFRFHLRHIGRQ